MSELKPCPFCGEEAIIEQTNYGTTELNSVRFGFRIRCKKCDATVRDSCGYISMNLRNGAFNIWHDDRPKAIEAWNSRCGVSNGLESAAKVIAKSDWERRTDG